MDWITSLLFLIISLWYLLFRCVMLIFDFLFRHVILISAFCCFIIALCYWSWRRNQQMDLRNASQNNELRGIESLPHLAYHACPESTALELPRHDADLHDIRVTPSLPTFTHDKSHSPWLTCSPSSINSSIRLMLKVHTNALSKSVSNLNVSLYLFYLNHYVLGWLTREIDGRERQQNMLSFSV